MAYLTAGLAKLFTIEPQGSAAVVKATEGHVE